MLHILALTYHKFLFTAVASEVEEDSSSTGVDLAVRMAEEGHQGFHKRLNILLQFSDGYIVLSSKGQSLVNTYNVVFSSIRKIPECPDALHFDLVAGVVEVLCDGVDASRFDDRQLVLGAHR